jgi:hypothetical protein
MLARTAKRKPATAGAAALAADDPSAMAPITAGAVHTRSPCENSLDSFLDREFGIRQVPRAAIEARRSPPKRIPPNRAQRRCIG